MSHQKGLKRGELSLVVPSQRRTAVHHVPQLQTTTPTPFSLRREQPVGRNHSLLPRWLGMKPHSRVLAIRKFRMSSALANKVGKTAWWYHF